MTRHEPRALLSTWMAILALAVLAAGQASAWTGAATGGTGPVTYNGKDNPVTAPYELVYASGNWVTRPAGSWTPPPGGVDISTTGTPVTIPNSYGGGNAWSAAIPLGFTFNFYGEAYTTTKAYGYGFIGFGTTGNPSNFVYHMNSNSMVNRIIAPIADTDVNFSCSGTVRYQTFGAAPDRVFVIQFTSGVVLNGGACNQSCSGPCGSSTYQIRLYEGTNVIEVHYQQSHNVRNGSGWSTERYGGIRGPNAASGLRYTPVESPSSSSPAILFNNRVVQYRPTGVVPVPANDTYTWDFDYGNTPSFTVAGFPANTAGLFGNDHSVASASLRATYTAGSLTPTSGVTLRGVSCAGAGNAIDGDGGFCIEAPGNQNPCALSPLTFQYWVNDAWGVASTNATVTISVVNCNLPPIARDDPHLVNPGVAPAQVATRYQVGEDASLARGATAPVDPPSPCTASSGVLCNDWDADTIPNPGPPTTLAVASPGPRTTLRGAPATINADGSFTYTPTANFCGLDQVNYQATDTLDISVNATVHFAVACTADNPTANADAFTIDEDCSPTPSNPATPCIALFDAFCAAPSGLARGVQCNDTDPDTGDDLGFGPNAGLTAGIGDATGPRDTAVLCTGPSRGTVHDLSGAANAISPDGGFQYRPDVNANGPDSFTYRLIDAQTGFTTGCVTVSLAVTPRSDGPVAVDDTYTNVPNVGTTTIVPSAGVLLNDLNPDQQSPPANGGLSVSLWESPVSISCPGASGMDVTATSPNGGFTVTPPTSPAGFQGTCFFDYTVTNGFATDVGRVFIEFVTPTAPFAVQDGCTLDEDPVPATWACGNVFANDFCFASSCASATAELVPAGSGTTPAGTLALAANGAYTFTPATHWNGGITFSYRFRQVDPATGAEEVSPTALLAITVNPVNDRPVAIDRSYPCIPEDSLLAVSAASGLLVGADDSQGGAPNENHLWGIYSPPRLRVVVPPLPLATPKGMVTSMSSDGSFVYVPNPNEAGTDSFQFTIQDSGGTSPGIDTSLPRTVTLCLLNDSDPPVAVDDGIIEFAQDLQVRLTGAGYAPLLANDYDPDTPYTGDAIAFDSFTFVPAAGSGNTLGNFAPNGDFTFQPGPGWIGMQTFQYRIRDTTGALSNDATVTIRVVANLPPNVDFDISSQSTFTGQTVSFVDRSVDPEGSLIGCWIWDFGDGSVSFDVNPSHTFTTPGEYVVTLTVCDAWGARASGSRVVVVSVPPFVPASEPDFGRGSGGRTAPVADAGPDQTVMEGDVVQLPGSSNPSGAQSFAWSQIGPGPTVELRNTTARTATFRAPQVPTQEPVRLTFQLRVTDAGAISPPDLVEVLVQPRNRAPEADAGRSQTAAPGDVVTLDGSGSFDADATLLTYQWVQRSGPQAALDAPGSMRPSFTVPEGSVGQTLVFELTVSDGRAQATDSVQVLVTPRPRTGSLYAEPGEGTVRFVALADGVSFTWDFGDGQTATTSVPEATHRYAEPGQYVAKVTVRDAAGNVTYSSEVTFTIDDQPRVEPVASRAKASGPDWLAVSLLAGALLVVAGAAISLVAVLRKRQKR